MILLGISMFNEVLVLLFRVIYMVVFLLIMIGGIIGFMLWIGNGDICEGFGL